MRSALLPVLLSSLLSLCINLAPSSAFPSEDEHFSLIPDQNPTQSTNQRLANRSPPNTHLVGCIQQNTTSLPFCDTTLSIDARVRDLISRIYDEEKPALLTARGPGGHLKNISRLGVPTYYWGINCLHSADLGGCIHDENNNKYCATNFPSGPSIAATFDKNMMGSIGRVIARELRAAFNAGQGHGGLDSWGPVINLSRDPRWGRIGEGGAEDPLLMGELAKNWAIGFQTDPSDPNHLLAAITLKHMAANSLENSDGYFRNTFNVNVSLGMLADYYLVPFKKGILEGRAKGIMCSYNSVRGIPACLSPELKSARDTWGFDGYVVSDTDAISDADLMHHYVSSLPMASCRGVTDGGCDVNSGDTYNNSLLQGVSQGYCSMDDVNEALYHSLKIRFELGLFDPVEEQPLFQIPVEEIGSEKSQSLSLLASQESIVLLRNDNNLLPLKRGITIAVVGPHATAQLQLIQPYPSTPACTDGTLACILSPFQAIAHENVGGTTLVEMGCDLFNTSSTNKNNNLTHALEIVRAADVVVMGLGIETCGMDPAHNAAHNGKCLQGHLTTDYVYPDQYLELEAHDRTTIDLPPIQHDFAKSILQEGKPTILFLLNSGMVSFEPELHEAKADLAVIEAFYPGPYGAQAIAGAIFGSHNRFGRLPYTIYGAGFANETPMMEHDLTVAPGRTYRYYTGQPLFRFGFGLSLTSFHLSVASSTPSPYILSTASPSTTITFQLTVTNNGPALGDVVITAFFKPMSPPPMNPSLLKHLFQFERVKDVQVGKTAVLLFEVGLQQLAVTDMESGDIVATAGQYRVLFEDGTGEENAASVDVAIVGQTVVLEKFPA